MPPEYKDKLVQNTRAITLATDKPILIKKVV